MPQSIMREDVMPVFLAWALAATAASAIDRLPAPQTGSSRIVLAAVADSRNRPLVDLGPDDFVVRENNTAREVFAVRLADYPIAILLDNGGAARADFEFIRKAAARFVGRIGGERPVAIGTLGDPPTMLTTFGDSRAKVLSALEALTAHPSADSLLFQSAANAAREIQATGAPFSAIVIVSASAIDATRNPQHDVLTPILDSGAIVHVVANRTSTGAAPGSAGTFADMLRTLTDQTRGQYTTIFSAASYQTALDRLADRLSAEMMIEFIEPPDAIRGVDVQVGVRIPGARVRGLGVK
jgi:hypothetical protein